MSNNTYVLQEPLNSSHLKAMPEGGSVITVSRKLELWRQRSKQRQQLASLDQVLLDDIGISADQALLEANKYFWQE